MGSAVYQPQPHCGLHGPNAQRGSRIPGAWLMLSQEQGSWTREQRAQWSHHAPGGSWEQGGSQQQASPTPSPGQIRRRGEGQLRRPQAGRHAASRARGLWGRLSIMSAHGRSGAETIRTRIPLALKQCSDSTDPELLLSQLKLQAEECQGKPDTPRRGLCRFSDLLLRGQRLKAFVARSEPFWPLPLSPHFLPPGPFISQPERRPGILADSPTRANCRLTGILARVFSRGKPFLIRASSTRGLNLCVSLVLRDVVGSFIRSCRLLSS